MMVRWLLPLLKMGLDSRTLWFVLLSVPPTPTSQTSFLVIYGRMEAWEGMANTLLLPLSGRRMKRVIQSQKPRGQKMIKVI